MHRRDIKKIVIPIIIGIIFINIYGPIAFMKDGIITRQRVNSFDELYELGPARRHECIKGEHIYIIYFGMRIPRVKKEIVYQKNGEIQKKVVDVDVQRVVPGFYYVSWDTKCNVYRMETIKKYYLVIPYC